MRVIVQKFGGTSVSTAERRAAAAERVQAAIREGFRPVVVVSAMGRRGDPYATDTLIDLARDVSPEMPDRDLDLLMSCGEIISTVLFAGELRNRGVDAVAVTGGQAGIVTDNLFANSRILRVDPSLLINRLERGQIPVVAGFQGVTEDGEVTTLGRGGSDTTAAALGGALRAEVVEIFTDVDGVKTADPRIVPEARTLTVTTYEEIVQMAHQGAKVIHPRAVEIAMQRHVPLRIKSTFSDSAGTLVTFPADAAAPWMEVPGGQIITGVTHIPGLARIRVTVPDDSGPELETKIFRSLADAGISVDLINVSPEDKKFCVADSVVDRAERILRGLGLEPSILRRCAKVSVVGTGMRGLPGVMARVVEALHEARVKILQTADSHVTISCLVELDAVETAVRALHAKFGLGSSEPLAAEKRA